MGASLLGAYLIVAAKASADAVPSPPCKMAALPPQPEPALSVLLTSHIFLPSMNRWRKTNEPTKLKTAAIKTNVIKTIKKKERKSLVHKSTSSHMWFLLQGLGFDPLGKSGCFVLALAIAISYKFLAHIPLQDRAFAFVFPLYLGIINRVRFQRNEPARRAAKSDLIVRSLLFHGKGAWFIVYVNFFAIIGMLLPLVLCLFGPTVMAAPAASHTMLLFAQVLTEAVTANPKMHEQPRVMVPIGFNAYRMLSLWRWVKLSWEIGQRSFRQQHHPLLSLSTQVWALVGFSLAVINFVAWSYNLFVFLLLRVVPQYWDKSTFPTADVKWRGQLIPVLG